MIHTRTLIIARGASARWLGLPSEQALIGHGVSSCATCDGFFFSGKDIAVIGGGDSAMEEALFLTRFATKVTLINRSENFRASKIMLDRAMAHPQIEFLTNTMVEEVLGVEEKEVRGLQLKNQVTGEESILPVSAMFLGIGHDSERRVFEGQIDLDEDGYMKTTNNVFTTLQRRVIPGVFACGDVQDRRYRQAITAAGQAAWLRLRWRSIWKSTVGKTSRFRFQGQPIHGWPSFAQGLKPLFSLRIEPKAKALGYLEAKQAPSKSKALLRPCLIWSREPHRLLARTCET